VGKANLAAVNYHFGDKRKLYVEAVRKAHMRRAEQFPLPQWPDGTTAEKKLRDFVFTLLQRVIEPTDSQWEGELMMREIGQPSEACEALVRDSIRPHFAVLNVILAELAPRLPERERHLVAFSVVGQCLHYRVTEPIIRLLVSDKEYKTYRPELLAEHITGLTLRGLAGKGSE
jgi:AcrR family transcriptional regulator